MHTAGTPVAPKKEREKSLILTAGYVTFDGNNLNEKTESWAKTLGEMCAQTLEEEGGDCFYPIKSQKNNNEAYSHAGRQNKEKKEVQMPHRSSADAGYLH